MAIRALPAFFAGLLTLAWVYRIGRDLLSSHGRGIFAALTAQFTSVFFLAYMIHARYIHTGFTLLYRSSAPGATGASSSHPRAARQARAWRACCWAALACSGHTTMLRLVPARAGLCFTCSSSRRNRHWWRPCLPVRPGCLAGHAYSCQASCKVWTAQSQTATVAAQPGPVVQRRLISLSILVRSLTNGLCRSIPAYQRVCCCLPCHSCLLYL